MQNYTRNHSVAAVNRKITNVGNSLGVTLPLDFLKNLNLEKGDNISIMMKNDEIIIKKAPQRQELNSELLNLIYEEMEAHDKALRGLALR